MFPERSRSTEDFRLGEMLFTTVQKLPPYTRTETVGTGVERVGHEQIIMDMLSHGKFRSKRVLVQHPVDIRKLTVSATPGVVRTTNPSLNTYICGGEFSTAVSMSTLGGSTDTAAAFDAQQTDITLMRAHANLAVPDWDVGVGLAEASQTINFIMKPSIAGLLAILKKLEKAGKRKIYPVRNYLDSLPSGRKPRPASRTSTFLSRVSEAWLGLRYGAVPLMMDIQDGMSWFEKSLLAPTKDIRSKRGSINVYDTFTYTRTGTAGQWTFTFRDTVQTGTTTTSGIFYLNEMSWVGNRAVQLGLSPTQLLHTLYETFPLSFMLDWSVNLGDWLRTKCPIPGINQLGCFTSVKQYSHLHRETTAVRHYYSAAKPVIDSDSGLYASLERLQRAINLPLPDAPRLNVDRLVLNLARSLDTASLLWQTRPRFLRSK